MDETRNIAYYRGEFENILLPFDLETGEILINDPDYRTQRLLKPGDKVLTAEQLKAYQEKLRREKEDKENRQENFVQQGRGVQQPMGQMKQSTLHYLMTLYPMIDYDEKPIQINGKRANSSMISNYFKLGNKAGGLVLQDLVDNDVLRVIKGRGKTKYYTSTGKYVIKGEFKDPHDYTVKVKQEKMQEIIKRVEEETQIYREKRRKEQRKKGEKEDDLELYPLSLLAAAVPFFHFQTFLLCKNYNEDILNGKESVVEALKATPKIMKHLSKTALWRLVTGQPVNKMRPHQREKLSIYFEILIQAGAIAQWGGRKNLYFIHPDLVFVSRKVKDEVWYEMVKVMFGQSDDKELTVEEEEAEI
ncbi:hypothetical protein [Priestia megaterium]|uniref:hypothetical protein n=1 Tax=Priestia megaterium TaxID=1404 RepID=UPI000BF620EA|nr:hypothetical protein [Priestia megaterium]PFR88876.1 hypothetical protein COK39_25535 [Priestia megaterium]